MLQLVSENSIFKANESSTDVSYYSEPSIKLSDYILPPGTSRHCYAVRINNAWRKTARGLIETCLWLASAKMALDPDAFEAMIEFDLVFEASKARKFQAIGANEVICANLHKLPPPWTTVYDLSKLSTSKDKKFLEEKFADGSIHPRMSGKDAIALRREAKGETIEDQANTAEDNKPENSGNTTDALNEAEARAAAEAFYDAWSRTKKCGVLSKCLDKKGHDGELIAEMSDGLKVYFEERILGQKIKTSKSSEFAKHLTGNLHLILRLIDSDDRSAKSINDIFDAGHAMLSKARDRGISRSNIVVLESKAKRPK
jgi:hypothetical protein